MTHTNSSWVCLVLALLVSGCGIMSVPPTDPPASPASAPQPPPRVAADQLPPEPAPAPSTPPAASKAPAPSTARPAPAASPAPAPPKAPQAAAAPSLDLKALERRIKETSAVGVLTKLSLKNQVDDLVQRFRAFHQGQRPPSLAELRPAFDLLLMKVLSLLQDKDPPLARDIDGSRNALWGVLTDREKLASYN